MPDQFDVTPQSVSLKDHLAALSSARYEILANSIRDHDLRYEQRFKAQQEAISLAVTNGDRAISATLESAKAAVQATDMRYQQRYEAQQAQITAAFEASEKVVTAAMLASSVAVSKAEAANEKRFEAVNEFRAQLNDQTKTFVTSPAMSAIDERIAALTGRLDRIEGASKGMAQFSGMMFAIIGAVAMTGTIIISLIVNFHKP